MLGIQVQPQLKAKNNVSFMSRECDSDHWPTRLDEYDNDEFDRDSLENERDKQLEDIDKTKSELDNLAENLENSDNKYVKKSSKLVRTGAAIMGLLSAFVMTKYSTKLGIETLKSIAKSPAGKSTVEAIAKPARSIYGAFGKLYKNIKEAPVVKDNITKLTDSSLGKAVKNFMEKDSVKKIVEPVRETLKAMSFKNINKKAVQNTTETVLATSATVFEGLDTMTGRNDDKTNFQLATGL